MFTDVRHHVPAHADLVVAGLLEEPNEAITLVGEGRVVLVGEAPELEQDALDTGEIVQVGQRFSHHPDLVVFARPELAPAEDQPVVGIAVVFRDGRPGHGTGFYRSVVDSTPSTTPWPAYRLSPSGLT